MMTGAVQVPPDGRPIVLLPDHATVGGYPVVACVITADLPLLGQLAPGRRGGTSRRSTPPTATAELARSPTRPTAVAGVRVVPDGGRHLTHRHPSGRSSRGTDRAP